MITQRRPHTLSIHQLMFLAFLVAVTGHVFAQGRFAEIPENASAKQYGSGWVCDRGYREASGACIAVKVPVDAYATDSSYGRAWECNWGFRRVNETCMVIKVPPNAYLNSYGSDRWTCDR